MQFLLFKQIFNNNIRTELIVSYNRTVFLENIVFNMFHIELLLKAAFNNINNNSYHLFSVSRAFS